MMSRKNLILVLVALVVVMFIYNSLEKKEDESAAKAVEKVSTDGAWAKYSAPDGSFDVLFPSVPQHVSEVAALPNDSKSVKYDIYIAQEKDGSTFMVSSIQYPLPFDASNQDTVLEGVMKEMVSGNPTNVLQKTDKGQFLNFPALDFSIQNSDFSVQSKAILANKTLYVLTVMDRDPAALEKDFGTFIGSLVLKNEKSEAKV